MRTMLLERQSAPLSIMLSTTSQGRQARVSGESFSISSTGMIAIELFVSSTIDCL
ncbi:MAG TPA: hypothetical protein VMQ52_02295 [Candidatus Saccharimonadales bacterium]|nr:hypothetical protein [Candidatus Saccharimonadales bacterium]